jgi:hypothetical protein
MLVLTNTSGVWTYISCKKAKIKMLIMKMAMRRAERTAGVRKNLRPLG